MAAGGGVRGGRGGGRGGGPPARRGGDPAGVSGFGGSGGRWGGGWWGVCGWVWWWVWRRLRRFPGRLRRWLQSVFRGRRLRRLWWLRRRRVQWARPDVGNVSDGRLRRERLRLWGCPGWLRRRHRLHRFRPHLRPVPPSASERRHRGGGRRRQARRGPAWGLLGGFGRRGGSAGVWGLRRGEAVYPPGCP